MSARVFVYDPTSSDHLSKVRGVGRYLQVLKEALPDGYFSNDLSKASDYDVLINPFVNVLANPVISRRYADKQIAVIHDLIPLKYPEHFPSGLRGNVSLFLNRQALKQYDVVVTDSDASKKDIMNLLKAPHEKIEIIFPALPKMFVTKTNIEKPQEPYCIYVGDATWNKNLVRMAHAVMLADVQCVIVGNVFASVEDLNHPWQKELKEFLTLTKNGPHFIFPGYVSDQELLSLYQKAFCNILVSHNEGFGYSFFEAASQGLPSVLSDIPVFKETAGNSAVFVDHTDEESIADGIQTLMKDTKTRAQIVGKLKQRVRLVSPEVFQKNLLKLF